MKTLVELLDVWGKSSGEDETDEEIRAGLVGTFQEWLGQPGLVTATWDRFGGALTDDPGRILQFLRREAGRGSIVTNLPPEVGGIVQPYSMGPLFRWNMATLTQVAVPPMSTLVNVDRSELMIRMCLHAPGYVQRAAQAQGIKAMVMVRPKGIELVNPKLQRPEVPATGNIIDRIEGLT